MSDEIKKYVDRDGLKIFLQKIIDAYKNNDAVSSKFSVAKAGKVANAITFVTSEGNKTWDGSSTLTIDVAGSGPIPVGVLKFKGVKATVAALDNLVGEEGDVWYVKEDSNEYIWVPADQAAGVTAHWEQMGSIIDLSDYATTEYVDGKVADLELEIGDLEDALALKADDADLQNLAGDVAGLDQRITDVESDIDTIEGTIAGIQTSLTDNYYTKTAADAKFADKKDVYTKSASDEKFVAKVDHTTDLDIAMMFPTEYQAGDNVKEALDGLEELGALSIESGTVEIPSTSGAYGYIVGSAAEPRSVAIMLGEDAALEAEEGKRLFSVQPGSKLEIVGEGETKPTVTAEGAEPSIFIANDASVTLENIELSGKNYSALQSNGLNENSDFYLKNCKIVGPCYMPACGNLVIENCEFIASDNPDADAGALYVKSGSITIRNSHFAADINKHPNVSGPWKHNNNGWNGIATALVLENCNYGGHGNLKIDIDAASTFVGGYCETEGDESKQYDNVGILVINYKGNEAVSCNIAQDYFVVNVEESAIGSHYFTTDGRGDTEKLTEVTYQA